MGIAIRSRYLLAIYCISRLILPPLTDVRDPVSHYLGSAPVKMAVMSFLLKICIVIRPVVIIDYEIPSLRDLSSFP